MMNRFSVFGICMVMVHCLGLCVQNIIMASFSIKLIQNGHYVQEPWLVFGNVSTS